MSFPPPNPLSSTPSAQNIAHRLEIYAQIHATQTKIQATQRQIAEINANIERIKSCANPLQLTSRIQPLAPQQYMPFPFLLPQQFPAPPSSLAPSAPPVPILAPYVPWGFAPILPPQYLAPAAPPLPAPALSAAPMQQHLAPAAPLLPAPAPIVAPKPQNPTLATILQPASAPSAALQPQHLEPAALPVPASAPSAAPMPQHLEPAALPVPASVPSAARMAAGLPPFNSGSDLDDPFNPNAMDPDPFKPHAMARSISPPVPQHRPGLMSTFGVPHTPPPPNVDATTRHTGGKRGKPEDLEPAAAEPKPKKARAARLDAVVKDPNSDICLQLIHEIIEIGVREYNLDPAIVESIYSGVFNHFRELNQIHNYILNAAIYLAVVTCYHIDPKIGKYAVANRTEIGAYRYSNTKRNMDTLKKQPQVQAHLGDFERAIRRHEKFGPAVSTYGDAAKHLFSFANLATPAYVIE